jgi:hypothetical protein
MQPLFPGHEFHTDPGIVHQQISVSVSGDSAGIDFLYLLSHDADIGGVIAPFILETIEF